MMSYAARNALLPNVSGFALSLGFIVGGTLLVEIVFSYPGLGYYLFQAVGAKDYPLMQGIFLVITLSVLLANLLADVVYAAARPAHPQGGLTMTVDQPQSSTVTPEIDDRDATTPPPRASRRFRFVPTRKAATGLVDPRLLRAPRDHRPVDRAVRPGRASAATRCSRRRRQHWFGTTHLGQDVFSQILVGTRGVMVVGFMAGVGRDRPRRARRRHRGLPRRRPATSRCRRCPTCSW